MFSKMNSAWRIALFLVVSAIIGGAGIYYYSQTHCASATSTDTSSASQALSRLTLYVHFHSSTHPSTQSSIIDNLSHQGYTVSGPTPETEKYVRRIEYFHKQDQVAAEGLATTVNAISAADGQRVWARLVDMGQVDKCYKPGELGVWL